ncbi:Hypothetical protein GLP15_4490 [Giardia lamblia P15]|uniref:Uncharacterized protein n=1 Tax=Giardia intestinalis (strain P15) TaxID=658858 RepID=E1F818_GIAIA|nr:Hypothetical protein GLP15_4490 [Giardia lamblia P15]
MYQNALIADAPSIALSSQNSSTIRAHSIGCLPRYTSFNSGSNGICLNAVYPKWMYSPPVIKRKKEKIVRNFIKENKWLAAHPDFIHEVPPSTHTVVEAMDAAKAAYANFISTMRNREQGSPIKMRHRWSTRDHTLLRNDQCAMQLDAAERQLLAFADRVNKQNLDNVDEPRKDIEENDASCKNEVKVEVGGDGDTHVNTCADANQDSADSHDLKTFVDELLEDSDFINEMIHAKDKVDDKISPAIAKPNLAESPFGRPITIEPTFRYERGPGGETLVLVHPENFQQSCTESKFLYSEEELAKIAATSMYGNYMLRKREDMYNAPYLIPYTFRSSRI